MAQTFGGMCGMTLSMLFRGVGLNEVYPSFVNPYPQNPNFGTYPGKEATVVFAASALFTMVFVVASILARANEKSPF